MIIPAVEASSIGAVHCSGQLDVRFIGRGTRARDRCGLAVVLAMLMASGPISRFVDRHPTVKMLALSFLVLIGTNLVAEGIGQHIPKGYTYFAMAFAVVVEMLNIRIRSRARA